MINERRTNPVVARKLGTLMEQKSWDELDTYLLSLSNADFRSAGHILSEDIMLRFSGNDFWEIFSHLSLFRPKAFLGTCLKAAVTQYRAGKSQYRNRALLNMPRLCARTACLLTVTSSLRPWLKYCSRTTNSMPCSTCSM